MSGSDLDSFMLACSDLNQPARSRLFQNRPGLKDIKVQPRPSAPSAAFQTSQKARDWSQLDLGDAFSQAAPPPAPPVPLAAPQASNTDWDDFAEFQSCPPAVTGQPVTSVDLLNIHPPAGGGLAAAASVDLLSGRPPAGGVPAEATGFGSVDLLSSHPPPANGGMTATGVAVHGGLLPRSGHGHVSPNQYTSLSALSSASANGASQNGLPGQGTAISGLSLNWSAPAEHAKAPAPAPSPSPSSSPVPVPAPAAGYVPVSAVLPAAKPTRFRQGLVPQPPDPEDEFSDFVTAEPAAVSVAGLTTGGRLQVNGQQPLDTTPAALAAKPDLLSLDAPLAPAVDLALPLNPAPNHLTPVTGPSPTPVAFTCSLVPPVDFSSSLVPPPSSEPAPASVSEPPTAVDWSSAADDEDFGEFVSVEQPAAGGMRCRQGSLPSLDLQVAASDGGEVSPLELQVTTSTDSGQVSPLEPDRRDAAKHDKYDSFRQEITSRPPTESALVSEWRRCLQACYELIQEGVALFGSVDDLHTCSEVAGSPQGANYIDNLSRVFRVAGRIEQASERHGCRHQLDFILSETCKAWANLTAFVSNSPTRAAVADGWPSESPLPPATDAAPCCGVCLLPAAETGRQEPTLTCAGRPYHACCANLWVNRVADVLPALQQ